MLELVFLFIVIPRRMTRLARERNRSAFTWTLAAIGLWIGTEVVVVFVLSVLVFLSWYLWETPRDPEDFAKLTYIPGLIGALVSAELIIRHLRAKPARNLNSPQPSYDQSRNSELDT